ncbi:MAG: hypothetical protein ACYCT1_08350 [Steroidobacteraceae bacterium]
MAKMGIAGLALRNAGGQRQGRALSVQDILRQKVDQVGDAATLAALEGGVAPTGPQPVSVQDALAVSRETRVAATELAAAATARADEADKRRKAAETQAATERAAGVAEADTRWTMMQTMLQPLQEELRDLRQERHQAELDARESEAAKIAADMRASNDAIVARLNSEIDQLKTKNKDLEEQVTVLSKRRTANDELLDLLGSEDPRQHRLARAVLSVVPQQGPATPAEEDPQTQLEREAIKPLVERMHLDNDRVSKGNDRGDRLVDLVERLGSVIEQRLGGPGLLLANADLPQGGGAPAGTGFIDPEAADAEYVRVADRR